MRPLNTPPARPTDFNDDFPEGEVTSASPAAALDVRATAALESALPTSATSAFSGHSSLNPQPSLKADVSLEATLEREVQQELAAFEQAERKRLGMDEVSAGDAQQWRDSMLGLRFTAREKQNVTILIAGLTAMQDSLIEGALKGMGYKVHYMGMHDNEGLRYGKEFGNRGQCNPTYFTVGHLVKFLCDLRDKHGLSAETIIRDYVYMTAGACGPCRFGMYLTEYRKALRDAGFEGFRVIVYEQEGGLEQNMEDVGMPIGPTFYWHVGKAVVCGDILNALGYRIRPYEVNPGDTDRALAKCKGWIYDSLVQNTNIIVALNRCRQALEAVPVDKLRPRVKTSIIGEFWAMTTEGDGNYGLQRFIEQEGGECDIQLTTAWILYTIWEFRRDTLERITLRGADNGHRGLAELEGLDFGKRMMALKAAEALLRSTFQVLANTAGLYGYHLPDMDLVAEVSKEHYHNDLRGGEGHMEVGKFILNTMHQKAHLTVSVKPFGCMPSSGVSDGVQSLVTRQFPGSLFCAVETNGDGAANFYSRVQLFMFKGREAAETELKARLEQEGITLEEARTFLKQNPRYASSLHLPAHQVAGTAANLIHEIAPLIRQSRLERLRLRVQKGMDEVVELTRQAPRRAPELVANFRQGQWKSLLEQAPQTFSQLKADTEIALELLQEQWPRVSQLFLSSLKHPVGRARETANVHHAGVEGQPELHSV